MSNVETNTSPMFSDSLFCDNSRNNSSNRTTNHENRRDSYDSSRMDNEDQFNQNNEQNDSNEPNHDPLNIAIFRYKFTQEFMDHLYQFSKIHQYDDRKSFKEAWLQWVIDNDELVGSEVTRLSDLGYKGDIVDKMFKSGRYYFRKKSTKKTELPPQQRKHYVCIKKEMLDEMDTHIARNIRTDNYKPSDGFSDFCNCNMELLKTCISNLIEQGMKDSEVIREKIKKTYKNRYFIYRQAG
jgi:hypothetical protein